MVETLDKDGLDEGNNLREKYEEQYNEISEGYSLLGENLLQDLRKLLKNATIDVINVSHRTKDFDKFLEKIRRKKYKDPLNEIEDICGLRIVCKYNSDLDKITSIICDEFIVLDYEDKSKSLSEDEIGYLSRHFIVKVKENWLDTPSYRGLGHLKAEIQLRTALMDAWAIISHELVYKNEEQIPLESKRQLNLLSAILENTDRQFDDVRIELENSKKEERD